MASETPGIFFNISTPLELNYWINKRMELNSYNKEEVIELITRLYNTENYKYYMEPMEKSRATLELINRYNPKLLIYSTLDSSLVIGIEKLLDKILELSLSKEVDSLEWKLLKIIDIQSNTTEIELYF